MLVLQTNALPLGYAVMVEGVGTQPPTSWARPTPRDSGATLP